MYKFLVVITIVFGIFFLGWGITRVVKSEITFERKCKGYLKRAADANTVKLAKEELSKAINYIEAKGYTQGYTSLLWTTPDEDLGFWYANLKSSLDELNTLPGDATSLEKSNMLMKLRETIVDQEPDGISITYPSGISIYPYNWAYCIWGCVSGILLVFFWIWAWIVYERY